MPKHFSMKTHLSFFFQIAALIITAPALAQSAPDASPFIGNNSILTYAIKETNRPAYNYIISITDFDENGDIAFDWKTNETDPKKGHSSMKYSNLNAATALMIKIREGNETLRSDESRIFLSWPMIKDISNYLTEFTVDGSDQTFLFTKKGETKKIDFDNNPVQLDYHSGTFKSTYIGVIDLGKLNLLGYYYNDGVEYDLKSINNSNATREIPVEKKQEKGEPRKMGSIDLIFAKIMWPTLVKVEDYDPTNGGSVTQPFTQTYDYRLQTNADLPPSYVDAFVVDLKYIYEHKAKFSGYITGNFTIGEKYMPENEVLKVFNVYLNVDASELYGYRPWTNQQFVKSLSDEDRKKLATEAASYIMMYGFKEK